MPAAERLRERLRGVMVPLVTPFTASFAIDWPAFDEHVSRLLASGIEVLIPADLVGEAWALESDEKVRLFDRTVQLAGGRAIVLAKISESSLPAAARLAREAASVGVDAVKVPLPADPGGHEALDEYVTAVGPGSGLPFLLETSGTDIPMQLIDRLAQHPGLVGIEEPGLDLDRFDMLVQRYGAHVAIIAGSEDVLGFTLLLGAAGFMTASPNFAPAFMRALWSAAAAADAVTTVDLYRRLRRYRRLFEPELRAGRPLFVSYTKAALDLLGHPVGPPRPPLRRLSNGDRRVLGVTLRDALGLKVPAS
jgi:4-hydroxy-tetrahydrodipicolinate synthase